MDVWLFPTISYVKICKVHHPIVRNNYLNISLDGHQVPGSLMSKRPRKWQISGFRERHVELSCLVQDESAQVVPPWETNGWNLKIIQLKKEKHLNQSFIFGFHVGFRGCKSK